MSRSVRAPRVQQRIRSTQPIDVQVASWLGLSAECVDVSHGGLRVRLTDPVQRGDRLVFRADLTGRHEFHLEAEVCHVAQLQGGDYVAGLRWVGPQRHAASIFEALVKDGLAAHSPLEAPVAQA